MRRKFPPRMSGERATQSVPRPSGIKDLNKRLQFSFHLHDNSFKQNSFSIKEMHKFVFLMKSVPPPPVRQLLNRLICHLSDIVRGPALLLWLELQYQYRVKLKRKIRTQNGRWRKCSCDRVVEHITSDRPSLQLQMHSVGQNSSTTADEVAVPSTDVMHYGLPAQMIHDKKAACVIWGVKTGISLNYYYRDGEACICCAIKSNGGRGKRGGNATFFSTNLLQMPMEALEQLFSLL